MAIRPVLLNGYCSKTRRKFFIEAVHAENVVIWKRAFTMMGDGQGIPVAGELNGVRHDARNFKCPCCGTGAAHNFTFWHCGTCDRLHCMGSEHGVVLGGCGSCAQSVDNFAPVETIRVQLADASKM